MVDLVIWVSIGAFLLFPSYLCVLTFNKTLFLHQILVWACFHSIFAVIFYIVQRSLWMPPTIVLVAYVLYHLFTYLFHVRDMFKEPEQSNISQIVKTKAFQRILFVVMVGLAILWVVDSILVIKRLPTGSVLEMAYFIATVSISYVQILLYYFKYYRRAQHMESE